VARASCPRSRGRPRPRPTCPVGKFRPIPTTGEGEDALATRGLEARATRTERPWRPGRPIRSFPCSDATVSKFRCNRPVVSEEIAKKTKQPRRLSRLLVFVQRKSKCPDNEIVISAAAASPGRPGPAGSSSPVRVRGGRTLRTATAAGCCRWHWWTAS